MHRSLYNHIETVLLFLGILKLLERLFNGIKKSLVILAGGLYLDC